jgi:DNA polymerase I
MSRLLLVDGHNNLYRAFFAIKAGLAAPDGTPTNAAYGFLRMQQKLLRDLRPSHVGVAFDVAEETFRSRLDPRYKAQRPAMPEDLRVQIPLTQEALRLLGVAVLLGEDVEADDVIGTLARQASAQGFEVVIASADKDLMQLVRDPLVKMWHTRLERLLDEQGVTEVFGVPPAQVPEVLAIMGDKTDNVPGCPGIGEKGAFELIRRWGSVAEAYAHLDEVTPPRLQKALTAHRAEVDLSLELVRIRTELDVPFDVAKLDAHPPDIEGLARLYRRLGFTSLAAELDTRTVVSVAVTTSVRQVELAEIEAALAGRVGCGVALGDGELAVSWPGDVLLARGEPRALAGVLAGSRGAHWCHDAKDLLSRVISLGHDDAATQRCAMLASYLASPGESQTLSSISSRFRVEPPSDGSSAEQARAVAELVAPLDAALAEGRLRNLFDEVEMPLVGVLAAMERRGIALDSKMLEDFSRRLSSSLAELEREIHHEAGGPFNIASPAQLAEVLFTRRGLPVLRRTGKTKAPSTDADVLKELALRGHHLPALILEHREQAKLKSTYVDALPAQCGPDGRIHTTFNQAVAATGRLSSSNPNLQNIPARGELGREVRRAFVTGPGRTLLAADYSQIELRVLAHLADEPALQRAFAAGEDIHRTTAALVFGMAPELIGPDQRRAAKVINFGLIYGMGAFSLGKDLGVSSAEAQRFIDAYFARLPRVRDYLESVKAQARTTGMVTTLLGRVRHIAGLDSANAALRGNAERQAINAPVQGTAADLIKVAMITLHRELVPRQTDVALLLQVHDELVLDVDLAALDWASETVRRIMEGVAELKVPLLVDLGHGSSWAEAKG